MAAVQIHYLVTLAPPSGRFPSELFSGLEYELLVAEPAINIVRLTGERYECNLETRALLIDRDLDRVQSAHPQLGFRGPGDPAVIQRWPVIVVQPTGPHGPHFATTTVSWDNLVIEHADDELAQRMMTIVGLTLGRYHLSKRCLETCQSILRDLREADSAQRLDPNIVESFEHARRETLVSRVITDPRTFLYWGCERRLLDQIGEAWNIAHLDATTEQALRTTAELYREHNEAVERRTRAQQTAAARRVAALLAILTLFGGVSAILSVVDFATAEGELRWSLLPRGLIAIFLTGAFVAAFSLWRRTIVVAHSERS